MDPTLNVGLAAISLPDSDGRAIRLGLLWLRQPAVIACAMTIESSAARCGTCSRRPWRLRLAKSFSLGEIGTAFPLLVDQNREAHQAMEVKSAEFVLPFAQRQFRSVLEPRLPRPLRYSLRKNPFQLGGSFVFRPGDVDRFVHVSENV
jgi:hypothetical protein